MSPYFFKNLFFVLWIFIWIVNLLLGWDMHSDTVIGMVFIWVIRIITPYIIVVELNNYNQRGNYEKEKE